MHHLTQQDIDPKLRRPHVARYKRQLAETLHNPAVGDAHRRVVLERLSHIHEGRRYRVGDPPPPGALDPGPVASKSHLSIDQLSIEELQKIPTWGLRAHGKARGIDLAGLTKAQMIEALAI